MKAERIARALGGRRCGRGWIARCPSHEDREPSLSLADGDGGRLFCKCFAGCDARDVLASLRSRGLLEGGGDWRGPDPAEAARRRAAEADAAENRRRQAAACWSETAPLAGTLAERYLRGARGIRGPLPASLRFHSFCWHLSARRLPALVAAVQRADGRAVGVQRTYLAEPGCKADVEPVKASLGPIAGGAVRLCRGPGALLVCEGAETGLALADALGDRGVSVWATLGTSGMAGLELPWPPGELVIAPDGDAPGQKAAEAMARRAVAAGWLVRLMAAPGTRGRDWADEAAA